MIDNLNIRAKAVKFLKENRGANFQDLGFGNGFLPWHQQYKQQQKKICTFGCIKTFFASKDNIKKVKRQYTEREKIFINHKSDIIPEYIKNTYHSSIKKTRQ